MLTLVCVWSQPIKSCSMDRSKPDSAPAPARDPDYDMHPTIPIPYPSSHAAPRCCPIPMPHPQLPCRSQVVRYGNAGQYYTATHTGGVSCTNAVFGDPNHGVIKVCPLTTTFSPLIPHSPPLIKNSIATPDPYLPSPGPVTGHPDCNERNPLSWTRHWSP